MEALSGIKGDNSVKIIGPDLDKLEALATKAKNGSATSSGDRGRRHLPHPRPVAPRVPRRSDQVPAVGRADRGRQQRRPERLGCQGPLADGRGGKAVRHLRPLAEEAPQQRDRHPRHPRRHHQQHRRAEPGARRRSHGGRHRPGHSFRRRRHGQHVQSHQQHAAPAAARPGVARRRQRLARSRGPISSGTALRRFIASRANG